jgi:hypothetical protein
MPNPILTPAILQTLLTGLSRTIARGAADDPASTETAAALLAAFLPQTPVQAMLAAQAVALHHAAIDCFGRAMQTPEDDSPAISRLQRNGASLTRAFTATLHTLHRCQLAAAQAAEAEQEDLLQREEAAPPAPQPPGAHQDGWEHPLQREDALDASPIVPAQAGTQGSPPEGGAAALGPRFREDDGKRAGCLTPASTQNPLQRETLPERPAERPWEQLSEAEQFAILYPERVAAGATSHEDVDLWLTTPRRPAAR